MDRVLDYEPVRDKRRLPIVELLVLAAPTIAQMASYTVMQFIDTWILAHIGDRAATAAANGGMVAFCGISFGMGVLMLVNTLASQSFGRRDYAACGRYCWQGVWLALFYAAALLPLASVATFAFTKSGHEPALIVLENTYMRIVLALAVLRLISVALGQFLLAIDHAHTVFIAAVTGVCFNAVCAYGLVLGRLGMPELGVAGAAWAQNIGSGVEMLVLLAFAVRPGVRQAFGLNQWRLREREFVTLLKTGLPSGLQFIGDVLPWTLFLTVVIGVFHTDAMAATTYVFRYMSVSFMPAIGVGTAATALVGRYIGRNQKDVAAHRAHLAFRLTVIYMAGCGLLFLLGRYPLMRIFTSDPAVLHIGATVLIFAAVYQIFDAMYIVYVGALRGAGDTLVPGIMTIALCLGITVCGGYAIARLLPALGPSGPWAAATVYGVSLGFFMMTRFIRGGWRKIDLTIHNGPAL